MPTPPVVLRRFRPGDAPALYRVHHSAIHRIAAADYSAQQLQAWAPDVHDAGRWAERMAQLQPFMAECGGDAVGYADLQASGHIDHFFVSGQVPRRGIGRLLMQRIHAEAQRLGLAELTADVSTTAEPFFARQGFEVVERRTPVRRGVVLHNARMRKTL